MRKLHFSVLIALFNHWGYATQANLVAAPDFGIVSTPQVTHFAVNLGITPAPIANSVNLERLHNGVWQILGPLYDDGTHGDSYPNDGIYTTQVLLNESAPGVAQFRVSAAFKGTILRSISNICTINIAEHVPFSTPSSDWIADGDSEYAAGQVIIILKPGFGWSDARAIASANQGEIIGFAPSVNSFQLSVPAATTAALLSNALSVLGSDSRITDAFPNFQANLTVSNDLTTLQTEQPTDVLAYQAVGLFDAWSYLANSISQFRPVTVGIIDSGIDASHPAFADVNFGSSPALAKTPLYGAHGTAVAGIIGAENSNSPSSSNFFRMNGILAGVPGQWDGNSAIPYTLESRLMGDYQSIVSAIDSLALANADVVNISLGIYTPGSMDPITLGALLLEHVSFLSPAAFTAASAALTSAITQHPGIIFVVSAGNVNSDVKYATPANITLNNVIVVGGTSVSGGNRWAPLSSFPEESNYGAVTVAAPAEGVYTTNAYTPSLTQSDYVMFDGTSASAPLVTGTVGLMLSVNHELQPTDIKTILASTATPEGGFDQPIGGLLNIVSAIKAVPIPRTVSSQPPTAEFLITSGPNSSANGQTLALIASTGGGASVTFADQSYASNVGGSITSWIWMINGAQVSTASSFRQQLSIGTYQVILFVADNTGTFGPGATGVITVSAMPPPMGTVAVNATLDGNSWTSGPRAPISYTVTDPNNNPVTGITGIPFSASGLTTGSYTLNFTSGGPANTTLTGILPCGVLTRGPTCSTTLGAGQTLSFILQFTSNPPTAGFTMSSGTLAALDGQTLNLALAVGAPASVTFDATKRSVAYNNNTIGSWQWIIDNSVVSTSASFSESLGIGAHTVTLVVTDGRGAASTSATATVVVKTVSTATWVQQFPATSPPARSGFMMVYDAARSQTVIFGGTGVSGTLGDTWVWDGNTWKQKFPAVSPPATHDGQMVYDEARQQTILVGGYIDQAGSTATWIWDGNTWAQASTPPSPALAYAAAAYDKVRQEIVMFSGHETPYAFPGLSNTTWIWNGSAWSTRDTLPTPPPRSAASMTWDNLHNCIVMTGGLVTGLLPGGFLMDTWIWNGINWTKLFPGAVPQVYLAPFVFNSSLGTSILFEGFTQSSDTWAWNGTTWTDILPQALYPRLYYSNMVYDAVYNQIVLFGGIGSDTQGGATISNQTWILTGQ